MEEVIRPAFSDVQEGKKKEHFGREGYVWESIAVAGDMYKECVKSVQKKFMGR
jgi:hypothetical protein